MTITGLPPAEPVAPYSRRRRWLWALLSMIAVAALALIGVMVFGRADDPTSLYSYNGVNETWRLPVGTIAFVGADVQPCGYRSGHHRLFLKAVVPQVTVNTAHATVRVVECTLADPNEGVGMAPFRVGRRLCASLREFRPGVVDLGFPATEIAYIVAPTTPGRVRVDGADVSYIDGSRAGTQHVGDGFILYVKHAKP